MKRLPVADLSRQVAAFYRFCTIADPEGLRAALAHRCGELKLLGTVLIAAEGINGTLIGERERLDRLLTELRVDPGLAALTAKYSAERPGAQVFRRLSVKVKRHIVAFADVDPAYAGRRVTPREWNRLLDEPDTLVIDTRNDYETAIGTFPGSLIPNTTTFREFPEFADRLMAMAAHDKQQKIAMFCTGGIRCEKASAYLRQRGFGDVVQLDGGVLGYFAETDKTSNRWRGECFVFDQRVSVDTRLEPGSYQQCRACRRPLSVGDLTSPFYEPGVSCAHCHTRTSAAQRRNFQERRRQVQLAEARGEVHVGATMARRIVPPAGAGDGAQ